MLITLSSGPLSHALAPKPRNLFDDQSYAPGDIITRDVAIIGGGSSGTYSAINLRALGKSVVVVEKTPRMGGPASTYVDPQTGVPVNYGVQAFYNSVYHQCILDHAMLTLLKFQWPPITSTSSMFLWSPFMSWTP